MEKRGHHKLEAYNFKTMAFNMVKGSYDGLVGARRVVSTSFCLYGLQLLRKPHSESYPLSGRLES